MKQRSLLPPSSFVSVLYHPPSHWFLFRSHKIPLLDLQNNEPQGHTASFFFFKIWGKKKKVCSFIYLVLTVLGLCCCAWVFSSCGEQGLLYSSGSRASHCRVFDCRRAQALGTWASVAEALGLRCLKACGIFQEQGLNPCPLNWQADT